MNSHIKEAVERLDAAIAMGKNWKPSSDWPDVTVVMLSAKEANNIRLILSAITTPTTIPVPGPKQIVSGE